MTRKFDIEGLTKYAITLCEMLGDERISIVAGREELSSRISFFFLFEDKRVRLHPSPKFILTVNRISNFTSDRVKVNLMPQLGRLDVEYTSYPLNTYLLKDVVRKVNEALNPARQFEMKRNSSDFDL